LHQCLQSLYEQEALRIEYLLVDDGSSDGSYDIALTYSQRYPERFFLLRQSHQGQGAARNLGLRQARGEYVGFVDSDDWIDKKMYKQMLGVALKCAADVVVCDYTKVMPNETTEIVHYASTPPCGVVTVEHKQILFESGSGLTNKIIRKEHFENNKISFPEKMVFEDLAIMPSLMSSSRRVVHLLAPFYYYRMRLDSTIHTGGENVDDFLKACHYIEQHKDSRYHDEVEYLVVMEIFFYAFVKYRERLEPEVFLTFHKQAVHYFKNTYPQWKKNPYIRAQNLYRKLYLYLVIYPMLWPIKVAVFVKKLTKGTV